MGFATAVVALTACGASDREKTSSQVREAVIGGAVATGDPAVVQMRADYGNSWGSCTGTLIAPNVVLTAAHCIEDNPPKISVYFGTYADQAAASEWKKVKEWHHHPSYPHPYINEGHDCAVLILDAPVTNIAPKPYSRVAMTQSSVGRAARIVGFGVTNGYAQTGGGTKRTLSTKIVEVSGGIASIGGYGGTSCQGDSGGPMFIDENGVETVGAISSFGVQNCIAEGSYARTELCADWIDTFVKGAPPPPSCTPSCSGKACGDDGCGGSCGACAAGQSCDAGACVTAPPPPPPPPPPTGACPETEPNDQFMNASAVCASGVMTGTLSSVDDADAYTLTVAPGATYDIRLAAPSSVNMGLYKVTANGFDYIGVGEDGANGERSLTRTTATGGTYYLSIYRYVVGSSPGESWRVSVSVTP